MDPIFDKFKDQGVIGAFDSLALMFGEENAIYNFSTENLSLLEKEYEESVDIEDYEVGITYMELRQYSIDLSLQLYFRYGVRQKDRVLLVCNENPLCEIVALLACLRLGCVFIPVDSTWLNPQSKSINLDQIISNCEPKAAIVLCDNAHSETILQLNKMNVNRCAKLNEQGLLIEPDTQMYQSTIDDANSNLFFSDNYQQADAPLYIYYTSGSTGAPKGVQGSYKGLIHRLTFQMKHFPSNPDSKELQFRRTPLIFIDSLVEIFFPLISGFPIWCPPSQMIQEYGMDRFIRLGDLFGVTRITILPSQLLSVLNTFSLDPIPQSAEEEAHEDDGHNGNEASRDRVSETLPVNSINKADILVRSFPSDSLSGCSLFENNAKTIRSMRYVSISGEECPATLFRKFLEHFPEARLIQLYGSTEVMGDVSFCDLNEYYDNILPSFAAISEHGLSSLVPIGFPMDDHFFFVLLHPIHRLPPSESDLSIKSTCSDSADIGSGQPFYTALELYNPLHQDNNLPIEGELIVLGPQTFLGYHLKNDDVSNPRRIPNPFKYPCKFQTSSSLKTLISDLQLRLPACYDRIMNFDVAYITGDLVQMIRVPYYSDIFNQNYLFFWKGRKDRQIKLHGVRVELEAAERLFRGMLEFDSLYLAYKAPHLVLFLKNDILSQHKYGSEKEIKYQLLAKLKEVDLARLLPHAIICLDTIPRKVNGKVDQKALDTFIEVSAPSLDGQIQAETNKIPTSVMSPASHMYVSQLRAIQLNVISIFYEVLKDTWNEISQQQALDGEPDFFALGGDSVKSIEILWRLREAFPLLHPVTFSELSLPIRQLSQKIFDQQMRAFDQLVLDDDPQSHTADQVRPMHRKRHLAVESMVSEKVFQEETSEYNRLHLLDDKYPFQIQSLERGSRSGSHVLTVRDYSKLMCQLKLEIKWKAKFQKCIDASPLVCLMYDCPDEKNPEQASQGIVVIGSHGGDIQALTVHTGEVLWEFSTGMHIEGSAVLPSKDFRNGRYGNHSCLPIAVIPSFYGKDIHGENEPSAWSKSQDGYQDRMSSSEAPNPEPQQLGRLWGIDILSGVVKWQFSTKGELKGTPALSHFTSCLYVGSYDGNLYCIDGNSGSCVSQIQCAGPIYASPCLCVSSSNESKDILLVMTTLGRVLLVGFDHKAQSVSLLSELRCTDGKPIFSSPIAVPGRHEVADNPTQSQELVVFADTGGMAYCLAIRSSTKPVCDKNPHLYLLWERRASNAAIFSSPCVFSFPKENSFTNEWAFVIGSHDGTLSCLTVSTGEPMWTVRLDAVIFGSVFINNTGCFVTTAPGDIFIVSPLLVSRECNGNQSPQLSISTNINSHPEVSHLKQLPGEIYSSPVCLSFCNYLLVGCRDDRLYCFQWKEEDDPDI